MEIQCRMVKRRRSWDDRMSNSMFHKVEEERQIPLQWRETSIKSLHKEGESKEKIQESQRGSS